MALVEAARFYDSLAAGAAQSRLSEEGIDSFLFDMGMTLQGVGFAIPVRLMVDEDDLPAARRLLSNQA
jgi:Putative prokaryotic signal transducing protein